MPLRRLTLMGALALVTFIVGCTVVPETGRSRLMLISPTQETQMGLDAFSEIKQDTPISHDPAINARIASIGARIAASVGRELPGAVWEFVVFDEPNTVNAFALPGGKVGVYTGLINLAESDDELAIVMGHEIAHVTSRHGGERMSQQMIAGLGAVAVTAGTENSKQKDLYRLAYSAGATLGTLGYSRLHETEADGVGLRFAAGAGYDPRAGASFWRKMAANETSSQPKWLSTHPPSGERIANLEAMAPEYMEMYRAAKARYE